MNYLLVVLGIVVAVAAVIWIIEVNKHPSARRKSYRKYIRVAKPSESIDSIDNSD